MYKILSNLTTETKLTPQPCNIVVFSMLKAFTHSFKGRSFSIRYVMEGCEHYTINGNRYSIQKGQYLLANNFAEGRVEIDDKKTAKGICIGITAELVSEAVASYRRPDTPAPDIALDQFFNTPHFLESQYRVNGTQVGNTLLQMGNYLAQNPYETHRFNQEFYFDIAEKIISDYVPICRQLQTVPSLKQGTKADLLRRLQRGKAFMDTEFTASPDILSIAREAGISEYHFFRLFKAVYGVTPYQYLLEMRLKHAYHLLESGKASVSSAAYECGFADVYCLSKAFKKHFHIPPASIARK